MSKTDLAALASIGPKLDAVDETKLDGLPFGLIQLDRNGRIRRFNRAEGEIARRDPHKQIGRSFFDEVAPCTKVREFHGRFVDGLAKRKLHEVFAFRFEFAFGPQDVAVSLFYSQATDSVWVAVSRDPDAVAAAKAQSGAWGKPTP